MADTRPGAAADTAAAYTTLGAHPALADYLRRIRPEEGMLLGGRMTAASDGGTFDVVVPAAVEGVITEQTAPMIDAKLVVEGANGPTTPTADAILADKGILVVPDILANAGGVIVSYFEWVQANQSYWWTEQEVNERLRTRMDKAWNEVSDFSKDHGLSLRTAATTMAVKRVAEAHVARGLYP